jgi:hypothetical protein
MFQTPGSSLHGNASSKFRGRNFLKSSVSITSNFPAAKKISPRFTYGRTLTLLALLALSLSASVAHATNSRPFINAPLSPGEASPGGKTFTLTVTGTGFVSGATVDWNGVALTTTFVSSSKLTASVPAANIATAETANITVVNPAPGGGVSNTARFEVVKGGFTIAFAKTSYATDITPQDVTTGDFNGDGNLDLAVATGNNTVSILLGNGTGAFPTHKEYGVPANPVGIIAGDFNGDGKLDLATIDQQGSEVSVLIGNGDGTFQTHQEYAVGSKPVALATADVNGDGVLDIIAANYGGNTASVLLGVGNGTFKTHVDYATGNGPSGVAIGDFNLDGKLDLAVANANDSTVAILQGNGDGTFKGPTAFATAVGVNSLAVGDFNGDGFIDVAAGTSNKQVSVLLGTGKGTLQNHVEYSIGANAIATIVADANSDGKLDIITANYNDNTVSTLVGNGDGTFKGQNVFITEAAPSGVAVGDFNNNGKLDIVSADLNGNAVSINLDSWLVLSPTLVSFATQTSGDPSAAKTVTLTNKGTTAYTMGTLSWVGTDTSDFTQTNTCPKAGATLAAGASCTYSVVFTPTASENANAQLLLTSTNGSLIGDQFTGAGNIPITLTPRTQTFPTTLLNVKSKGLTNTFTNDSGVDIYFSLIDLEGVNQSDFSFTTTCPNPTTPLLPGKSCVSTVYFTPTSCCPTENETVTFVYYGNFTLAKQGLLINGVGTQVKVTPASINFGSINIGGTANGTVTIQNVASSVLNLTGSYFSNGTANDFTIYSNTCGYVAGSSHGSVPANGSCTFTLQFSPATAGAESATFNIGNDDPTGPQKVSLTGTGN